jgi:SHS2 domain-containing protein
MPYEYLEDVAISDVAFHAWGETLETLFVAAAEATMNVMVEDLGSIDSREERSVEVREASPDMLLFSFLQELIFFKDAEQLLLRVFNVQIMERGNSYEVSCDARGEKLDHRKHVLVADVKAVTLHLYSVKETPRGWEATVVLDI